MYLCDLDVDRILDRYEMTFARENHDRPLLHITYPSGIHKEAPPAPTGIRERYLNFDWQVDNADAWIQGTAFLHEGFPGMWCNLGPDVLTAYTGSELEFAVDTVWAKSRIKDWKDEPPLLFQRDGFYWKQMEKFLALAAERGEGKWLVGSGDLHSNADALSALRGPENLLLDLYDNPCEIHKRLAEMHQVFLEVLDAHFKIIHPRAKGLNSSWLSAMCRGRYATIQNDFCYMIGPAMFDEFFKDYVEKEASSLDRAIYHLDGPGAIPHVDSICASSSLDAIQWIPGPGGPGHAAQSDYMNLLKKIQKLGKGLWLYGSPEHCLKMARELRPEGCMYNCGLESKGEAESWAKEMIRVSSGR
ncbi:MAG: hypothetical protein WCP86_09785 [bacterium]